LRSHNPSMLACQATNGMTRKTGKRINISMGLPRVNGGVGGHAAESRSSACGGFGRGIQ
jgi:hypothetical protein